MHPIDRIGAVAIRRGPGRLRVFPGGWGDEATVAEMGDIEQLTEEPADIRISWGPVARSEQAVVRDGWFEAVTDVPYQARTALIRRIEPPTGAARMCLLMAAWNDHGFDTRQRLADELLARNIGSLILEIPYYGSRRIVADREQPIQTVADFARMGIGAVAEGRALLKRFRREFTMGVAGYSMGGNIAALVGATAGFPVAIAPLAASHSPGPVFLDGVISGGIRWEALGGEPEARDRLRRTLSAVSVLRLPAPAWTATAVLVAAKSDGFVPAEATRRLHEHWPGSELRWRRGGHATLLWRRRATLADAIAASFDRLDSLRAA
jgi:hypothetical protein